MYYYKFVKTVYKKTPYKNTILVSENLWNNLKAFIFV
jgi:hypothetical protein